MRIAEIFYSVQGEGKLTGIPSVFIRSSGCNLRCDWCDTPYASWNPEGTEMTEDEIFATVAATPARHVVMTGGEPMLARGVHSLLQRFRSAGIHITIETAGTLMPEGIACDLASVSPKLRNSTPSAAKAGEAWARRHEETRWRPEVLRSWVERYEHQLKFVIATDEDFTEIRELLQRAEIKTAPENILLMPEGRSQAELQRMALKIVDVCKEHGWRYCSRLHVDLFGNKRGT